MIRRILLILPLLAWLLAGCGILPPPTPTPAPAPTPIPLTATTAPPPTSAIPPTASPAAQISTPPAPTAEPLIPITFDVTLPPNTPISDTIYVRGLFQGTVARDAPLARQDGHATGAVPVSAGRSLSFSVSRGSAATIEKAADCATAPAHSAVAAPGAVITVTVAAWADSCVGVYDSRAVAVTLASTTLGVTKTFYVYTPPGYAQDTARRYPVLYLLRGHEREWINKREDTSRRGTNVLDVYETLLTAGQVGPLILVFPGISSADNTVPGLLTNLRAPELTAAAGVGTGRFEDYFLQELVPYVDSHYRTVATRAGRGVDGFSLGGFMSTKIAAAHPDLFSTVGAFDGLYFYADATCKRIDTDRDTAFDMSSFDPAFGRPHDPVYAAANNPPNLICNSTPAQMQSLHWFIQYGPESAEPGNSNYYRGVYLMDLLAAKGVQDEIAPPVLTGGHRWSTADEHMRQTFPLHWAVLGGDVKP